MVRNEPHRDRTNDCDAAKTAKTVLRMTQIRLLLGNATEMPSARRINPESKAASISGMPSESASGE